ncbi:MAG: metallophosphoesterase [Clostridia bacterium]|nr:metallophosphoesterase [Clostridia bacterium]
METVEKKYPRWSEITIDVGATAPFRVLHMSDTHLTEADERDDDRKLALAAQRSKYFARAGILVESATEYAKKEGVPIFHTGDLIDFVSYKNLDVARTFSEENDLFMAAGNHEFSLYVGEAVEDAAYRAQSLDKVQAAFKNDIRFSKREMGGVNFVALDNSYYLIEEWQLNALKEVVAEGKPVVLLIHNPLYCEALYNHEIVEKKSDSAYLMAVPEEKMKGYSEHRFRQQKADETTLLAYDYICSEPTIRAILTGHLHEDAEYAINDRLTQYMTRCTTLKIVNFR